MVDNALLVDAADVSAHWDEGANFKENCIEMFKRACRSTVFGSDPLQVGIIAIARNAKEEDKEWLKWQVDTIKKTEAYLQALQAGLEVKAPSEDEAEKRLKRSYGLIELFHKGKKEGRK